MTDVGVTFLEQCRTIMADLALAERSAASASAMPQGRVVMSLMATGIGQSRSLSIIAEFLRCHPQVEIELRLSDRYVDFITEGVDLAVRIGDLPDSGLVARKIGETPLILCGSPEYLETKGHPRHPDDLADHHFIAFVTAGTATRFRYRFMIDGEARLMHFPAQLTVDNGDALVAAALEAVGLVMVAQDLVAPLIESGQLIRVLAEFETPALPINIVQVPSRHRSRAVQALAGMFEEAVSPKQKVLPFSQV